MSEKRSAKNWWHQGQGGLRVSHHVHVHHTDDPHTPWLVDATEIRDHLGYRHTSRHQHRWQARDAADRLVNGFNAGRHIMDGRAVVRFHDAGVHATHTGRQSMMADLGA